APLSRLRRRRLSLACIACASTSSVSSAPLPRPRWRRLSIGSVAVAVAKISFLFSGGSICNGLPPFQRQQLRCRSPSFTNASPSSSPTCGSRPCSFVADKLEQRRTEASWSKLQRASPTTMVSILVIHVHVLSVDAL
uniref:Uncharacterized protein n=1 Tax=Aegilops tauschii subsp. strangulata TaxID=200361 RepID=A0A453BCL6_AEGTS